MSLWKIHILIPRLFKPFPYNVSSIFFILFSSEHTLHFSHFQRVLSPRCSTDGELYHNIRDSQTGPLPDLFSFVCILALLFPTSIFVSFQKSFYSSSNILFLAGYVYSFFLNFILTVTSTLKGGKLLVYNFQQNSTMKRPSETTPPVFSSTSIGLPCNQFMATNEHCYSKSLHAIM